MAQLRIAIPVLGMDVTNYSNAIAGTGGTPVVVGTSDKANADSQLEYVALEDFHVEDFDGLVLPGGDDVEPSRYGQQINGSDEISPELDAHQLEVLDRFVKAGKPVLGICRGHQLLNVYFGGTLFQHLKTAPVHSRSYPVKQSFDKVHEMIATNGTWLSHLYGIRMMINSAHHQAIDQIGKGLIIDSRDPEDGVIEAVHHESLPVWAVQFHPERMCFFNAREDTINGEAIFLYFMQKCRDYKNVK